MSLEGSPTPASDNNSGTVTPSTSTTQRVMDLLRQMIIQGTLQPGEKLKVKNLKQMLDAGASPIREALSLLTSDQLVERIDQRGFRVAPANTKHFKEILMLRCQLDDIALRQSITNGSTAWEEELVLAHHRLSRADRSDISEWETLHKAFHMSLLSDCDSPILLRFCDQLYDLNIRYRYLAGQSGRYGKRRVENEHKGIMEAAVKRDPDKASRRLIDHYTLTGDFLAEKLDM
ncbi:MAG: GntR family transcriptional regulator [Gammaproteobacteria bacterium]|nr:GntR family transcriptional regulator [Gammaproteobacteria bacterium]